ncbi:MAG: FAD-dependent oxidoreductase [Clostridiales Family XIII bacterium]|jgi:succinate dehydrogenase/fumarate reductase flavoprotein subunit|nr:FAD-dependent oxidoreductase [Clostridiales Family XIII bacterium]
MPAQVTTHSTDVLVVGGGIGGLAAAIRARENGAAVTVLEKANTERSGLAGSGIDHIQSYIPEVHEKIGYTEADLANDQFEFGGNLGGFRRRDLTDYYAYHSAKDVIELEKYGLRFRFEDSDLPGGFRVVPQFHNVPTSYHFEGRDVKRKLTEQALARGAVILNRQHVRTLLKDGGAVTGAVAVGTRDERITVVNAKTTILATSGVGSRLSSSATGSDTFENFGAPTASIGSGKILAAKAGAEVVNLEFTNLGEFAYSFLNYSFTVGLPSGSWWPAGRIVDEEGNVVVDRNRSLPWTEADYKKKYRALVDHYHEQRSRIAPLLIQGKALYFDLHEATDAELAYIWWSLGHEGKTGVMKRHLEKNGVNLRTARFPLRVAGRGTPVLAGIWVKDTTTETNVRNLYASGNEPAGTGMPLPVAGGALVYGYRSGEQAALRAKTLAPPADVSAPYVEALAGQAQEIRSRKEGDPWRLAERGLQVLIDNALGKAYTDKSVALTQQQLRRQRESLRFSAGNPHELSRVFEVLDLYDLAELVLASIRERKSSLAPFVRLDGADSPSEKYGDSVGVYWEGEALKAKRLSNLT